MAKYTETIIERNEKTNEYGVKEINEVVKLESACTKEFIWYKTVGDYKHIVCSFKTEKRMREAMKKAGF